MLAKGLGTGTDCDGDAHGVWDIDVFALNIRPAEPVNSFAGCGRREVFGFPAISPSPKDSDLTSTFVVHVKARASSAQKSNTVNPSREPNTQIACERCSEDTGGTRKLRLSNLGGAGGVVAIDCTVQKIGRA